LTGLLLAPLVEIMSFLINLSSVDHDAARANSSQSKTKQGAEQPASKAVELRLKR
jgi:hypothetical protein